MVRVVQEHEIPRRVRVNQRFDWDAIGAALCSLAPGEWLEVDGLVRDDRSGFKRTARNRGALEIRFVGMGAKNESGAALYRAYLR